MKSRRPSFVFLFLGSCANFEPEVGPLQQCTIDGGAAYDAYGYTYGSASGGVCVAAPAASGNVLIADQFNNRVIELTRAGDIVWSFGDGRSVPGKNSVVSPNDAERLPNGRTLIAGAGAPPGTEPSCPAKKSAGCPDNRVIIVDDASHTIVWQYGADEGRSGSGPDELNTPVGAVFVPTPSGGDILIADQGNNRVIEVSQQTKEVVWRFPPTGSGEKVTGPNSAERLGNGHTLIADGGGNRVIEVDTQGAIAWQYPATIDPAVLNGPGFASRLPDGHTLIADTNNNRVVEIDAEVPPAVVWTYSTAAAAGNSSPNPTRAVRLANGDTLIANQFDDQVIEVTGNGRPYIDYSYGELGVAGSSPGELNAPYDAKIIGDYTGLTPPM